MIKSNCSRQMLLAIQKNPMRKYREHLWKAHGGYLGSHPECSECQALINGTANRIINTLLSTKKGKVKSG